LLNSTKALQAEVLHGGIGQVSMATASANHDGLLAHVMFGGLPPMRGHIYRELLRHIYRELLRPDYVMQQYKPGCKLCSREHACSIQHCLGDRLVYQGGGGVVECILQECTAMGGPRGLQTGVWPW
jgi:hypothetical protein